MTKKSVKTKHATSSQLKVPQELHDKIVRCQSLNKLKGNRLTIPHTCNELLDNAATDFLTTNKIWQMEKPISFDLILNEVSSLKFELRKLIMIISSDGLYLVMKIKSLSFSSTGKIEL